LIAEIDGWDFAFRQNEDINIPFGANLCHIFGKRLAIEIPKQERCHPGDPSKVLDAILTALIRRNNLPERRELAAPVAKAAAVSLSFADA